MFLLCCLPVWQKAGAQFLNPTGVTQTFPGALGLYANSCYSMRTVPFSLGNPGPFDLYVSGWSNYTGTGRVVWRRFNPNSTSPFDGGQIFIDGYNIEVGITRYVNDVFLNVAYYKNSVGGLVFERYIWTGSGFSLVPGSVTLSTSLFPVRNINMDMYGASELAVVWSEGPTPGNSIIKCVLGTGLDLTSVITLTGTEGGQYPDVALSKNAGGGGGGIDAMGVHIVYAKDLPASGVPYNREFTEIALPFGQAYSTNPNPYNFSPIIEDINNIGYSEIASFPIIDCPDISIFSPLADWAYTYASDRGVEMRLKNAAAGVPPTTKNLVNGSDYGNLDISMPNGYYANFFPTIAYNVNGESIHVGWMYSGYPNLNLSSLLAVEISSDGSTLLSDPDYLRISTNPEAVYPQFSKNSTYSSFLYTTFLETNTSNLKHMFHIWGNTSSFRQAPSWAAEHAESDRIAFAPNPFQQALYVKVPAALADADMAVTLTDITGKNLYAGNCKGGQLEEILQAKLGRLAPGTYLLHLRNAALHYEQQQKLIKTE